MMVTLALSLAFAVTPIDDARKAFSAGDYARTVLLIENFLAKENGLDRIAKRDALFLQGAANFGLGLVDAAKKKFSDALQLDPRARPTELAPKITRVIDAVRAELFPVPKVERAGIPATATRDDHLIVTLTLRVRGGESVARPKGAPLELCAASCTPLVPIAADDGSWTANATLDLGKTESIRLTWFVRTIDTGEEVLGSAKTPEADVITHRLLLPKDEPKLTSPETSAASSSVVVQAEPVYKKWWLWVPIAVVVAGAVTTAAVVATSPAPATLTIRTTSQR